MALIRQNQGDLLVSIVDSTVVITFNRPGQRNALTFEMYDQLALIAGELQQHSGELRALILTGSGNRAFAAGTDISSFRAFSNADDALRYERKMDHVLDAIERIPIPTIAAIHGACTGGGAAIAAACDLRITDSALRYGFPIARTLGNCLSTANLMRQIWLLGAGRVKELMLTARLIDAEEALQTGLVVEVTDEPLSRAHALARQIAAHAPLTMSATKEAMRRLKVHAATVDSDDLVIRCYTSDDFQEGLEAFLAKRRPQWTGH